jgi:hypothetical protein
MPQMPPSSVGLQSTVDICQYHWFNAITLGKGTLKSSNGHRTFVVCFLICEQQQGVFSNYRVVHLGEPCAGDKEIKSPPTTLLKPSLPTNVELMNARNKTHTLALLNKLNLGRQSALWKWARNNSLQHIAAKTGLAEH